jgi:uncharacterized protein (DUF2267 family)
VASDFLARLQSQSGISSPEAALAMAAAVLSPLHASLLPDAQQAMLTLLPASLGRAILLQQPTTTAYLDLSHYVIQVANQEGIRREQAIVHVALTLSLLGPSLPQALREAFGTDLLFLFPAR